MAAVVPARPYKPRDKAKVEVAVQVVVAKGGLKGGVDDVETKCVVELVDSSGGATYRLTLPGAPMPWILGAMTANIFVFQPPSHRLAAATPVNHAPLDAEGWSGEESVMKKVAAAIRIGRPADDVPRLPARGRSRR